ncbi:MAG TPA: hypothetical protein DDY16_03150 [Tenacibaculum sp.]|nr:hypothetical protein [Tenacibaculum sp.]
MNIKIKSSPVKGGLDEVFKLKRIPDQVYRRISDYFELNYQFKNGKEMRLGNYYLCLDKKISDSFVAFIKQILKRNFSEGVFPEGFKPSNETLSDDERKGNFTFGSFDMAVTEKGLQNIEFQAVATYPISAAKMNTILLDSIAETNAFAFPDDANMRWNDFIKHYTNIFSSESNHVVLVDRQINQQKTKFEFFATSKELDIPLKIIDVKDIFEKNNCLYFKEGEKNNKITTFYNRILITEALYKDNYPYNTNYWKFRFDQKYNDLKYINHPLKQFQISKRLCPYIKHNYNPDCYELSDVKHLFKQGELDYKKFIWKHKWGAAGNDLIFEPNEKELKKIEDKTENYIAQNKIKYKLFKTDDHFEKIVELRFMTGVFKGKLNIVPMARVGHVEKGKGGSLNYKIHFSDNNKMGFGFSPVIIFDN